jgi:anti-sigma B factor antagonist
MGELAITDHLVVETERRDKAVVISLYGELDLASSPLLDEQLLEAETVAAARVVIDLGGLEFIDSSGLHVLVRAHERCRENDRELYLMPGARAVQRLFELTGADSVFMFQE